MAFVLLAIAVIVDAHQQQIVSILRHLIGILLTFDLRDGRIGIPVIFQFDDDGGRDDVLSGDEHQVGKALTRSVFAMDDIVVAGVVIGNAQHTGQRVLVVIAQDARRVLVVCSSCAASMPRATASSLPLSVA